MFLPVRLLACAVLALTMSACATKTLQTTEKLSREIAAPRIMLMPADVELHEMTAGGSLELNAQWTQAAQENMKIAIRDHLAGLKANFTTYQPIPAGDPRHDIFVQLQKLHLVVGETIKTYGLDATTFLPSKDGKLDWGLGPATTELGASTESQYALFISVRDSYTSSGRAAMQIAATLLLGVHLQGGKQLGYASLVDLKTGQIIWFNLLSRESGDLRDLKSARESVAMLLTGIPK